MKITGIRAQVRDAQRVNVMVDGVYRFSLDISQVISLSIKTGAEYTEEELQSLEQESLFGKVYARALEYAMVRPRSHREMRDYLYRKTRDTRRKDGAVKPGISEETASRVFDKLLEKKYVSDEVFASYWAENRKQRKGVSARRLAQEMASKGVDRQVIEATLGKTERSDAEELKKVINKKRARYGDEKKLITYLAGQGFSYDTIREALDNPSED